MNIQKDLPETGGLLMFVRFSMPGLERRTDAKHSSEPTIWLAASASEAAFGGEEEPRRTHELQEIRGEPRVAL